MLNLKSARELKPKNLNNEKISLISSKISSLNSRNQSNRKYGKTNKIIKKINTKEKTLKTINKENNLEEDNKIILKAEKKMISNLKKYNVSNDSYNKKIITDIIYDERKHIVSVFKNYLLWDETSDFLKRFYYKHESRNRLPKINHYYEKYTLFPPVYFCLDDIIKIMLKYIKRKKKYLEIIEENEDNLNNNKNEDSEKKEFNRIINPSDISQSVSLNNYVNPNNITNTFSSFHLENGNSSKDLGQLMNKIMNEHIISFYDDFEDLKNKNKSHEIIINDLEISKSLFNLKDHEIKKTENKKLKDESFENIIVEKNKTKLPKIGKILEVKKLDLHNINKLNIPSQSNNNDEKNYQNNNSDRQQLSNLYHNFTNEKSSNLKKKINQKPKTNFPNNLLITQKLFSTTSRDINLKTENKSNKTNEKKNKSIESLLKIIQYPKQISPRIKKNNKTQNKVIKQKRKTNLVIQTNSNKNTISSRVNTSQSKKENKSNSNIEKSLKKKNFTNVITQPINVITNNNITSSIYNINLNLNLGHALTNQNKQNKKNLHQLNNIQLNNVFVNKNNNKYKYNNIRNIIYGNPSIPFNTNSHLLKTKNTNLETKKNIENKRKDKISYDLNTGLNNLHISIQKQLFSNNNDSNNMNNNNNQPSLNININCNNNNINNNLIDKKLSRNEKKNLSNLKSVNSNNKGKNLVIPFENKVLVSKKTKPKIKQTNKNDNDIINTLYHETSMNLGKLRKKLNIQINKKYPLTSRNDRDIPYELISKMLKKIK